MPGCSGSQHPTATTFVRINAPTRPACRPAREALRGRRVPGLLAEYGTLEEHLMGLGSLWSRRSGSHARRVRCAKIAPVPHGIEALERRALLSVSVNAVADADVQ